MSVQPSSETDTALMLQTIPAFNRDKATLKGTDRPPALAPTDDLKKRYEKLLRQADKLASDKSRLESEVAVLREQNKRARKKAKRNDSGEGSFGASGSPSPTKPAVPGGGSSMSASGPLAPSLNSGGPFFPAETHRALLRPGDVGYAGNRARVGRIVQEPDFDPVSDSD